MPRTIEYFKIVILPEHQALFLEEMNDPIPDVRDFLTVDLPYMSSRQLAHLIRSLVDYRAAICDPKRSGNPQDTFSKCEVDRDIGKCIQKLMGELWSV